MTLPGRVVNLGVPAAFAAATAAYLLLLRRPPGAASLAFLVIVGLTIGLAVVALGRALLAAARPGGEAAGKVSAGFRAELEREKNRTLRALKELEFDHAMGKISDADHRVMADALRARAVRILRQLEQEPDYEKAIMAEVSAHLAAAPSPSQSVSAPRCSSCGASNDGDADFCKKCGARCARVCGSCQTRNDDDATFCKRCGTRFS